MFVYNVCNNQIRIKKIVSLKMMIVFAYHRSFQPWRERLVKCDRFVLHLVCVRPEVYVEHVIAGHRADAGDRQQHKRSNQRHDVSLP